MRRTRNGAFPYAAFGRGDGDDIAHALDLALLGETTLEARDGAGFWETLVEWIMSELLFFEFGMRVSLGCDEI